MYRSRGLLRVSRGERAGTSLRSSRREPRRGLQCGLKIQLAGLAADADEIHTVADGRGFTVLFGREGGLTAAMTRGWPKLLAQLRRAIADQASVDAALGALPEPLREAGRVVADGLRLMTDNVFVIRILL